jgi:nicotinamide phosphoribosyltransferase
MDANTIDQLYTALKKSKWAASNLVVGSGGGLLQKDFNRDTQRFAIKASYGEISEDFGGVVKKSGFNIQKDPSTAAFKKSKTGMLKLHPSFNNSFTTMSSANCSPVEFNSYVDRLEVVFEHGVIATTSFDSIIKRASESIKIGEPVK